MIRSVLLATALVCHGIPYPQITTAAKELRYRPDHHDHGGNNMPAYGNNITPAHSLRVPWLTPSGALRMKESESQSNWAWIKPYSMGLVSSGKIYARFRASGKSIQKGLKTGCAPVVELRLGDFMKQGPMKVAIVEEETGMRENLSRILAASLGLRCVMLLFEWRGSGISTRVLRQA